MQAAAPVGRSSLAGKYFVTSGPTHGTELELSRCTTAVARLRPAHWFALSQRRSLSSEAYHTAASTLDTTVIRATTRRPNNRQRTLRGFRTRLRKGDKPQHAAPGGGNCRRGTCRYKHGAVHILYLPHVRPPAKKKVTSSSQCRPPVCKIETPAPFCTGQHHARV